MPFGHFRLRPEAKQINGIDDTVELPNIDKPSRWESDVDRFFNLTYPTNALRQTIGTVVDRFEQPAGAKGLFFIESAYGSGKSHVLLTLRHVLCGQPAAQRWIGRWPTDERPQGLPTNLLVYTHSFVEQSPADFVHDVLLPWLEIPQQPGRMVDVQLIEEAIDSSPMLAGRRLVLILDELARWFSNLRAQVGGEQLVARAEAFVQAAGNYANRSDKLTVVLSALPGHLPPDVQAVIVRNAVKLEIRASDQQSVILHRIFENYDPHAVHQDVRLTVESFRNAYTQAGLPTGEVSRLCDELLKTYPIHPDLMKLVVERFPKGSNFQNERGALNFVARVVSLADDRGAQIVTPAHVDVRDSVIRRKLRDVDTSGTDLPNIAFQDLDSLLTPDPLHDQVIAAVLVFSLVEQREPGATREDVLHACVRPGLVPNAILASLKTVGAAEHVWQLQDRHLIRDRRNPGNTVATQARRELQRNAKQFQDYIGQTSIREVFGGTPLVYDDLSSFEQRLAEIQSTLNSNDVKFVICTRRLKPDERQRFFQARPAANLFVMMEPTDASYDVLADDTLLFEAAKAIAANRLGEECRAANQISEVAAYRREYETAGAQIKERLQGAFGRMLLWKTQPVLYDEIEIDSIQLRGRKFSYDSALQELKGFAGDAETHRCDVLKHFDRLKAKSVTDVEQVFRDTLGMHVPMPKDVVGDTLIGMAKDHEISLEHPNHTYCGPDDDYGVLSRNQRLELARCKLSDPRPQQAPPSVPPHRQANETAPVNATLGGTAPGVAPPTVSGLGGATPIPVPATQPPGSPAPAQSQPAVPETVGPLAHGLFLDAVQARLQNGALVEYAEVLIEIQDSLQPATAVDWEVFVGTVDKPTDIDLAIKLTRHVSMTASELDQWIAKIPVVPNAEFRAFLKVRRPLDLK